jgi:uroporphyrinogen III methyltransferase/synthase
MQGARVVVTRPRRQAEPLVAALEARGAEVIQLPAIRIEAMPDSSELDEALMAANQGDYDWLVFTSANAVEIVDARFAILGLRADEMRDLRVAAVGAATAQAVMAAGFTVSEIAAAPHAEGLAETLLPRMRPSDRVLYPRSAIGREVIPDALRRAGAAVEAIAAYRTVPETTVDPAVLERVRRGEIDVITFSSPSSVRAVLELLGTDRAALRDMHVVCAGPVTAAAAREAGLEVDAVSDDPGPTSMAAAIASLLRDGPLAPPPQEPASAPAAMSDAPALVGRSAS